MKTGNLLFYALCAVFVWFAITALLDYADDTQRPAADENWSPVGSF